MLKLTSFLTPEGVKIYKTSMPALENLLISRMQMYRTCYYHKTVRAFEILVEKIMPETLALLGVAHPDDDKERFLSLFYDFDEYSLFEKSRSWMNSENQREKYIGELWQKVYNRIPFYKLAYTNEYRIDSNLFARLSQHLYDDLIKAFMAEYSSLLSIDDPGLRDMGLTDESIKELRTSSFEDIIRIDLPAIAPRRVNPFQLEHKFTIFDPRSGKEDSWGVFRLVENIPVKLQIIMVFTKPHFKELIANISNKVYNKFVFEKIQPTSF